MSIDYAHMNTSAGERQSPTAKFNKPNICAEIQAMRNSAFKRSIPTADDETLNFLITLLSAVKPKNILELGTATGITASVFLSICPEAHVTTVERNEDFYNEAKLNFKSLHAEKRVTAILGDAGEVIKTLEGGFDFIFMDCAKVQYVKYLPVLKNLLKTGGILIADDVLLFGWITGECEVPKKRKMLYNHIIEYIEKATADGGLATSILNVGDGLAMSVKL